MKIIPGNLKKLGPRILFSAFVVTFALLGQLASAASFIPSFNSSAFNPSTDVTSIKSWLDASDSSTITKTSTINNYSTGTISIVGNALTATGADFVAARVAVGDVVTHPVSYFKAGSTVSTTNGSTTVNTSVNISGDLIRFELDSITITDGVTTETRKIRSATSTTLTVDSAFAITTTNVSYVINSTRSTSVTAVNSPTSLTLGTTYSADFTISNVVYTINPAVTAWADKTGTVVNDFTQATALNRPSFYAASSPAGSASLRASKSTIKFDGQNDRLLNNDPALTRWNYATTNTTGHTVFFVTDFGAQKGSHMPLFSSGTLASNTFAFLNSRVNANYVSTRRLENTLYAQTTGVALDSSDAAIISTYKIGAGSTTNYIATNAKSDTVSPATVTGGFTSTHNANSYLGNFQTNYLGGELLEVITYDRELTVAETNSVECYLARKWFITSTICDDTPPTITAGSQTSTNSTYTFTVVDDIAYLNTNPSYNASGSGILNNASITITDSLGDPVTHTCSTFPTIGNTTVTCVVSGFATQGAHNLSVTATDRNGNTSGASLLSVNFDNIPLLLTNVVAAGTTVTLTYNKQVSPVGALSAGQLAQFSTSMPAPTSGVVNADGTVTLTFPSAPISLVYTPDTVTPANQLVDTAGNQAPEIGSVALPTAPVVTAPTVNASVTSPVTVTTSCPTATAVVSVYSSGATPNPTVFNCASLAGPFPISASFSVVLALGSQTLAVQITDGVSTSPITLAPLTVTVPPPPTSTGGAAPVLIATLSPVITSQPTKNGQAQQTATTCAPLFTTNIKLGSTTNNSADVAKLQTFLNKTQGEHLGVDGIYKQVDVDAVKRFQTKYFSDIIAPFNGTAATGIVAQYTRGKINLLNCTKTLGCPYFTTNHKPASTGGDISRIQNFLNLLMSANLTESGTYDFKTFTKVKEYQTLYKTSVLTPLGLTHATGLWLEKSKAAGNKLMGCN